MDINVILEYFTDIDRALTRRTDVCAVGGTVLLLQQLKPDSRDLDIIVEGKDYDRFLSAHAKVSKEHRINVDIMTDRTMESLRLPRNYMRKSKRVRRWRSNWKHLRLWTISPYYLVISKICRWKEKDINDLDFITKHNKLKRKILLKEISRCHIPSKNSFSRHFDEFLRLFGDRLKHSIFM